MRISSASIGGTQISDNGIGRASLADSRFDCVSCRTGSILDQDYRQDVTGLPLAIELGHVMGISRLATARPTDKPNVVVARATNLSSLVTAMLLKMPAQGRQRVLEEYGTVAWATKVLRFANKMPGVIGISDGVRFALAMYFLVGISDAERKRDTDDARAYLAFARLFKNAEAELAGKTPALNGLGGLGKDCAFWDVGCHAQNVGAAIQGAAEATAKAVVGAVKAAGDGIQKAADWGTDILCKGLKGLLGEAIGGAICWIITKGVQIIVSAAKALIEIVGAAIEGLIDFVKYLGQGKPMEAIKALMTAVTKMLFLLFLPISEPFMGIKADKLKEVGEKVAKRNPFFPLSLVFGIIGVIKPDATSISTLILALSPAVAVLLAPAIMGWLQLAEDKCMDAVEKFIKLALVIFQGAMALADILPRLKTSVVAFMKKRSGPGDYISKKAGGVMDNMKKMWGKITDAFSKFKLADVSSALSALFALAPELLGGLLEDVNTEIPEIGEAIKAIQDAPKSIAEREEALKKFNQDTLMAMGIDARRQLVMEQAGKLQVNEAGLLTGRMIAERFAKVTSEQDRQTFKTAVQQELQRLAPKS